MLLEKARDPGCQRWSDTVDQRGWGFKDKLWLENARGTLGRDMDASEIALRPARLDELPRLQSIRAAAFAPVFASFRSILGQEIYARAQAREDAAQAEMLESLFAPGSIWDVFAAEYTGTLVGFVSVRLDPEQLVGEIGLNAVAPRFAGQGIGTRMYEFALAYMRAAGMRVATVATGGDPSHAPARRAYEKAGFDVQIPSVWMCRTLAPLEQWTPGPHADHLGALERRLSAACVSPPVRAHYKLRNDTPVLDLEREVEGRVRELLVHVSDGVDAQIGWCAAYFVDYPVGGGQSRGEGRTYGPMPFMLKFAMAWLVDWCPWEQLPSSRERYADWVREFDE